MTAKPKRKGLPQSRLQSWWNEFLFTRSFAIETTISPDECAYRLRNLAYDFAKDMRAMSEVNTEVDPITFELQLQRPLRVNPVTTAQASGTISVDPFVKLTIVAAKVGVEPGLYFFYLGMILVLAFLLAISDGRWTQWVSTPVILLIPIALWLYFPWRQVADRKSLIRAIATALDDGTPEYKSRTRWIWL